MVKGDLPGYGTVWCHPEGIANILSLARVADKKTEGSKDRLYRITHDSCTLKLEHKPTLLQNFFTL